MDDVVLKRRLHLAAGAAAVLALIGGVLVGSAPKDAAGDAPGARDDVGVSLLLVAIGIGTWSAIAYGHRVFPEASVPVSASVGSPLLLPGVQEAQERRELRRRYRDLAAGDRMLALEIGLGRPDRPRSFDDGGLVDLNSLDASALQQHADITAAEALSLIKTRDMLGRLTSVDELVVYGELALATTERLRDYAVFIG